MIIGGTIPNVMEGEIHLLNEPAQLEELTVTENGVYLPSENYDGFSKVTVNTPTYQSEEITITENGVYLPSENYDGFSKVTTNVIFQPTFNAENIKVYDYSSRYLHNRPLDVDLETSGLGYYAISFKTKAPRTGDGFYSKSHIIYINPNDYSSQQNRQFSVYDTDGGGTSIILEITKTTLGCWDWGGYSADVSVKLSKINIIESQFFGNDGYNSDTE